MQLSSVTVGLASGGPRETRGKQIGRHALLCQFQGLLQMIAIYERVSSATQDTAAQHRDLEQWARGRDVEWHSDTFMVGTVFAMRDTGVNIKAIALATRLSRPCVYRILAQRLRAS